MVWLIVVVELAILVGSWIDARGGVRQRPWLGRWLWWHLAPLGLLAVGVVSMLRRLTSVCARWAVARHDRCRVTTMPVKNPRPS